MLRFNKKNQIGIRVHHILSIALDIFLYSFLLCLFQCPSHSPCLNFIFSGSTMEQHHKRFIRAKQIPIKVLKRSHRYGWIYLVLLEIDRWMERESKREFNTFVEYYCVCGSNVFVVLKIRFENWIRFTLIYYPSKAFVPKNADSFDSENCILSNPKLFHRTAPHHTCLPSPRIYTTLVCYYVIFANEARLMGSRIIIFLGAKQN